MEKVVASEARSRSSAPDNQLILPHVMVQIFDDYTVDRRSAFMIFKGVKKWGAEQLSNLVNRIQEKHSREQLNLYNNNKILHNISSVFFK
jgi:hypothetical protein